ncbi:MAG: GAF domain-containing protein [Acidobacteriota bacterium]
MKELATEKIKELERKLTQLSILYSIASSIGVSTDEEEVLNLVIEKAMDNLSPEIGVIFLVDPDKKELSAAVSRGINIENIKKNNIKLGEGIAGTVALKGKPIEIEDISKSRAIDSFLRPFPVKSIFCYPIKTNKKVLGVIHLSKFKKFSLTQEERWILTIIANRAGIAIESANLYRKLQDWSRTLEEKVEQRTKEIQFQLERTKALEKVAFQISAEMDLSRSLPLIGKESAKILNADRWAIVFVDEVTKKPKFVYSEGLSREYMIAAIKHYKEIPGGKVIETQKPMFIPDAFRIPPLKELATQEGYKSVNIIPSNYHGEIVGGIIYYYDKIKEYSELEKELAIAFGELIAVAIANSKLFEKQRETIKQLKAINKMGRTIITSIETRNLFQQAVNLVENIAHYPFVFLLLVDGESNELVQIARAGRLQRKVPSEYRQKITEGMIGQAVTTGKIQVSGDTNSYPYYLRYFPEVNSEISVPIKTKDGKVIGVLDVQSEKFNAFGEDEIATIQTIVDQISVALENLKLYKDLEKRVKELSTLYQTGKSITSLLDLDNVLNQILAILKQIVPFYAGGILLFNPSLNALEIKASLGPKIRSLKRLVIKPGEGITGTVFQTKKSIIVSDVEKDSRYIPGHPHIRSEMASPLIYQDKVMGVINVESKEINAFNEDHLRILNYFATQAAIAIGNALLYEEINRKAEEMKVLYEIGATCLSTLELNKLLKLISKKVMRVMNVNTFYLSLYDEKKDEIFFLVLIDKGKELEPFSVRVSEKSGLTGWIIRNKKPIIFTDYEKEKDQLPAEVRIIGMPSQSYLGIPLIVRDKIIGVISIQSYKKGIFDQGHKELLTSIANQVALTIENAELFKNLEKTYKDLKESQKQLLLTEKLRALGVVSAGVAHDFNNILGAILGRAQLLSQQTKDKEVLRGLKIIEKAALGGAEIVKRIQEFAKVKPEEIFEPVNINQVVDDSLALTKVKWKDESEAKGIKIDINKKLEEGLMVDGNLSELREAITNIILNSIDALPGGGQISIEAKSDGDKVLLEIADNGIGMSHDVKEKAFDPFFTTKGVEGTGLGLSIVYGIIRRHKGELKIESEEGKGTTIFISLPKSKKIKKIEIKEFPKKEIPPLNILIIDDEPYIRELLSDILTPHGHKTTLAESGKEGIENFQKEKFDLVLTDIGMPEMSGWEVAKKIKSINPEIVIGFITGWDMQFTPEELKKRGADLVIFKPFKIEQILETISKSIELRTSHS